jgi:hypothetical protein
MPRAAMNTLTSAEARIAAAAIDALNPDELDGFLAELDDDVRESVAASVAHDREAPR